MVLAFLVYFFTLGIVFFTSFPIITRNQGILSKQYYWSINVILPLFIISFIFGFRFAVGVDFFSYKNIYEKFHYSYISERHKIEYLYYFLVTFLRYNGFPYYTMNVVMIFLTYFFIFLFLQKVKNIDRKWILFFYFTTGQLFLALNIQRHAVAIAIFIYSLVYLYRRNFIKYALCLLFGAGFHISILSLLPFYIIFPVFKKKILYSRTLKYILITITTIIMINSEKYFFLLMDLFLNIVSFTPYGVHKTYIFEVMVGVGSGIGIILIYLSGIICIIYSKKLHELFGKWFDILFFMFLFGLWGDILSNRFAFFLRFFLPFSTLRIIVYSMLVVYLLRSKQMGNYLLAVSFILLYTGYFAGQILMREPYAFVFEV